jgi:ubiquinone/menaquinone biosynthesis C-methylase UbiE
MVYHHIQDRMAATSEFKRVLISGGYLCIRTVTQELLDTYHWLMFFPGSPADRGCPHSFRDCHDPSGARLWL